MSKTCNSFNVFKKVRSLNKTIIAKTKAKHIIMSYSADGLLSKDYIMNVLKV